MRLVGGATGIQALRLSTGIGLSTGTHRFTLNAISSPRFVLTTMLLSGFTDVAYTVQKVLSGSPEVLVVVQHNANSSKNLLDLVGHHLEIVDRQVKRMLIAIHPCNLHIYNNVVCSYHIKLP